MDGGWAVIGTWSNRRLLRFVVALSGAAAFLGFFVVLVELTGGRRVDALERRVDGIEARLGRAPAGPRAADATRLLFELEELVAELGGRLDDRSAAPASTEDAGRIARIQHRLRDRIAHLREAIDGDGTSGP